MMMIPDINQWTSVVLSRKHNILLFVVSLLLKLVLKNGCTLNMFTSSPSKVITWSRTTSCCLQSFHAPQYQIAHEEKCNQVWRPSSKRLLQVAESNFMSNDYGDCTMADYHSQAESNLTPGDLITGMAGTTATGRRNSVRNSPPSDRASSLSTIHSNSTIRHKHNHSQLYSVL